MKPIDFPPRNQILGKPEEMTDDQCMPLPIYRGNTTDGMPCLISVWEFTKEEIETIQRTGKMYLHITSVAMPPVSLYTENPFIQVPEAN